MEIEIIRSRRKSVSLEIRPDLRVLLRAPYQISDRELRKFIKEKESWIEKHWQEMADRKAERDSHPVLTPEEVKTLTNRALQYIPERVCHYAPLVGTDYGRIFIRCQRTRWGSCSRAGNLSFNCLLMLTKPEVVDYVVVHELCHRLEMNHSPAFWAEVARVCPGYREARGWLKENGGDIMWRIRER
ncbi:MAG: M48 family metallopeptidase [Blautia sp.]|nr:M48 family metallopeptidase [Blautia sp.]